MSEKRHGINIGIERFGSEFFLTLKASGTLTHDDYEMITPMIDAALAGVKEPKIRALIDCMQLEGWELRAAWDDFKLGLKHGNQFVKIALYGNKGWENMAAKVGSWFIAGEIQFFNDEAAALAWLNK